MLVSWQQFSLPQPKRTSQLAGYICSVSEQGLGKCNDSLITSSGFCRCRLLLWLCFSRVSRMQTCTQLRGKGRVCVNNAYTNHTHKHHHLEWQIKCDCLLVAVQVWLGDFMCLFQWSTVHLIFLYYDQSCKRRTSILLGNAWPFGVCGVL